MTTLDGLPGPLRAGLGNEARRLALDAITHTAFGGNAVRHAAACGLDERGASLIRQFGGGQRHRSNPALILKAVCPLGLTEQEFDSYGAHLLLDTLLDVGDDGFPRLDLLPSHVRPGLQREIWRAGLDALTARAFGGFRGRAAQNAHLSSSDRLKFYEILSGTRITIEPEFFTRLCRRWGVLTGEVERLGLAACIEAVEGVCAPGQAIAIALVGDCVRLWSGPTMEEADGIVFDLFALVDGEPVPVGAVSFDQVSRAVGAHLEARAERAARAALAEERRAEREVLRAEIQAAKDARRAEWAARRANRPPRPAPSPLPIPRELRGVPATEYMAALRALWEGTPTTTTANAA